MKSIEIYLKNEEITLPVNYNSMLQGVIYNLLSYNEELSSSIHDDGEEYDNKKYKLFTFSRINGKAYYEDKKLTYKGNISFEIRSAYDEMIDEIEKSINNSPFVLFNKKILKVINIKVSNHKIYENSIDIKMITPLSIHKTDENDNTVYLRYDDEEFSKRVLENSLRKYASYTSENNDVYLSIKPIEVENKDKTVTTFKGTYVTAYSGIYHLEGSIDLINFLYYVGIGDRNSQGFGMFKLI